MPLPGRVLWNVTNKLGRESRPRRPLRRQNLRCTLFGLEGHRRPAEGRWFRPKKNCRVGVAMIRSVDSKRDFGSFLHFRASTSSTGRDSNPRRRAYLTIRPNSNPTMVKFLKRATQFSDSGPSEIFFGKNNSAATHSNFGKRVLLLIWATLEAYKRCQSLCLSLKCVQWGSSTGAIYIHEPSFKSPLLIITHRTCC